MKKKNNPYKPKSEAHLNMEIKMMLFFCSLMEKYPERNPKKLAAWGLYAYADAIVNKKSIDDIFSCRDSILLAYRNEMQKEFGLEILTPQEAEKRVKRDQFTTRTIDVTKDMDRIIDFHKCKQKYEEKLIKGKNK